MKVVYQVYQRKWSQQTGTVFAYLTNTAEVTSISGDWLYKPMNPSSQSVIILGLRSG